MTTTLQSLNRALHTALAEDERVWLLGEDVLDPYGGAFKVSRGLSTAFPDRVRTTPISEAALTGLATGMALRGLRPILEIMFGDFLALCLDQLLNHATKFRGLSGASVPMIVRAPMGGGRGYGATHSQTLDRYFVGLPGLKVVAPSHLHDPGAVLLHQIRTTEDPVLFVENKLLYPSELVTSGVELVDELPGLPTAVLTNFARGERPDVTLIAYGGLSRVVAPLLASLARDEIRVVAAFPSSIAPLPVRTLAELALRSGRVVIAEEGTATFNWGSEVAAALYERLWGRLLAPIRRVASVNGVIPAAQRLEDAALISAGSVEQAVLEVLT